MMTAGDFEQQPRGPSLFNAWQARTRIPSAFGEFNVDATMPLEDEAPPDADMVRQANELADFVRDHAVAILDKVFEHYQIIAEQTEWMERVRVPTGLQRKELAPYLLTLTLAVDRKEGEEDGAEPTIYIVPKWDEEHAIYPAVRDGTVEFQDL